MRDELIAVEVARATRDVFTSVLRELVAEYMSARAPQKLERAATNPARAVAFDMLAEWTRELTQEVLLQGVDAIEMQHCRNSLTQSCHSAGRAHKRVPGWPTIL